MYTLLCARKSIAIMKIIPIIYLIWLQNYGKKSKVQNFSLSYADTQA